MGVVGCDWEVVDVQGATIVIGIVSIVNLISRSIIRLTRFAIKASVSYGQGLIRIISI
jgi:hypothetical protein